jgi:hypothetical protein
MGGSPISHHGQRPIVLKGHSWPLAAGRLLN